MDANSGALGKALSGAPTITIAVPPITLPAAVHVHEPAPALVTKRNAGHVGMTAAELLRTLRAMRADPCFREKVISHGKSYRGAAPADVIAFLRAAPTATAAEQEDDGLDHDLLRRAGYLPPPRRASKGRR